MTTVWKSQPKRFCELCKCWFSDNINSVQIHEKGKNHQDNVKMKICQIGKANIMKDKQLKDYEKCMLQIEQAALKSHKKDVEEDLVEDEDTNSKRELDDDKPQTSNKKVKKGNNKIPTKRDKEIVHTPAIGKWIAVEKKNTEIVYNTPVDLQLPIVSQNQKTYKTPTNVSNEAYEVNVKLDQEIVFKEKTFNEEVLPQESNPAANTFIKKKKINKSIRVSQED